MLRPSVVLHQPMVFRHSLTPLQVFEAIVKRMEQYSVVKTARAKASSKRELWLQKLELFSNKKFKEYKIIKRLGKRRKGNAVGLGFYGVNSAVYRCMNGEEECCMKVNTFMY